MPTDRIASSLACIDWIVLTGLAVGTFLAVVAGLALTAGFGVILVGPWALAAWLLLLVGLLV